MSIHGAKKGGNEPFPRKGNGSPDPDYNPRTGYDCLKYHVCIDGILHNKTCQSISEGLFFLQDDGSDEYGTGEY